MKVAIVSSIPLFPTTEGNRRRVLNLVRSMAALGHEIHYVFLPASNRIEIDIPAHRNEQGVAHFTALQRSLFGKLRHYAKRSRAVAGRRIKRFLRFKSAPYSLLDEYFFEQSFGHLKRLARDHHFDAVMVEYVFNSRAFAAFPADTLRILDTHDSFADRHLPFGPDATMDKYWYSIPPSEEMRAMRRADIVVAIQEKEAELFRAKLGAGSPTVVTVGHPLSIDNTISDYSPHGATFIGSKAPPNLDAMTFFVDEILPRIVSRLPDFRLYVAGGICELAPDHPNIVKLGRVENVLDAFRMAPLSINPMRIGTGMNIKLLDAMGLAVPTVSTQTGIRGLDPEFTGGIFVVADNDPEAFAQAVCELSRDEERRRSLGRRALAGAEAWNVQQLASLRRLLS